MQDTKIDLGPAAIADEAVMAWLDARRDQAARAARPVLRGRCCAAGAARPVLRGYQWTCLFLPEGTRLRIWCRSEHGHAGVVGDRPMHQGRPVSPNQFVAPVPRPARSARPARPA